MDVDAMRAELMRLQQENESLKQRQARGITFKVSDKGALSVYGLGRFPVTLYKEQWHKLLGAQDELVRFLQDHDAELKAKAP